LRFLSRVPLSKQNLRKMQALRKRKHVRVLSRLTLGEEWS
jgi:hypothetical protein